MHLMECREKCSMVEKIFVACGFHCWTQLNPVNNGKYIICKTKKQQLQHIKSQSNAIIHTLFASDWTIASTRDDLELMHNFAVKTMQNTKIHLKYSIVALMFSSCSYVLCLSLSFSNQMKMCWAQSQPESSSRVWHPSHFDLHFESIAMKMPHWERIRNSPFAFCDSLIGLRIVYDFSLRIVKQMNWNHSSLSCIFSSMWRTNGHLMSIGNRSHSNADVY